MLDHERRLWADGYERIAGLDEAGRGCLAGPVVAAAVILPPRVEIEAVRDSKALSETQRLDIRETIEQRAVATAIARCSLSWPHETVVKGDAKSQSIAAASILAKTERDALMRRLHEEHPEYGWDSNVGYPTQGHYDALREHGATPYHRESFTLFRD
ncbi:MAG: ribonuclease HII [Salinibacter sp.]